MSKKISQLFDSDDDGAEAPPPQVKSPPSKASAKTATARRVVPGSDSDNETPAARPPDLEDSPPNAPPQPSAAALPKFKAAPAAVASVTAAQDAAVTQGPQVPMPPTPDQVGLTPPAASKRASVAPMTSVVLPQAMMLTPMHSPPMPPAPPPTPVEAPRTPVQAVPVMQPLPYTPPTVAAPQPTAIVEPIPTPRVSVSEAGWRQSTQVTSAVRQSVSIAPAPTKVPEAVAEWAAFRGLRGQVDAVYARVSKMEEELSTAQKNHESIVATLQAQQRETSDKHKALVADLQGEADEGRSRLQSFTDILNRKVEQVRKQEQDLQTAAMVQAELRAIVATQATALSNIKTELDSSRATYRNTTMCYEYSEKKVEELLALLTNVERERDTMLALLRGAHEQEIDALSAVYAQREAAAVQSHNNGLDEIQKRYADALTTVQQQLAATYQAETAKMRAELAATKTAWTRDKEEWGVRAIADREAYTAHAKAEVVELTARIDQKEVSLCREYTNKEKALDDRIARDRIDRAREGQEIVIMQRAREAELRAQFELQVEAIDKKAADGRQGQLVEYQRELSRLAEHHRAMERDLEKLHREKEREMSSRYRIAGSNMSDAVQDLAAATQVHAGQDDITQKMERAADARRERAESMKKQIANK